MPLSEEKFHAREAGREKKLRDERGLADRFLEQKIQNVEDGMSEAIRVNRAAADSIRNEKREKADLHETDAGTRGRERERSDQALILEREGEDRVRLSGRSQLRKISEANVSRERSDTDSTRIIERARNDLASQESSSLLTGERSSHLTTKNALVSRDQFLAVVSHDLKNPLGTISLSAAIMRKNLTRGALNVERLLKHVDMVERNAANMERMINDLLDVERMANGKLVVAPQSSDVCILLAECQNLFSTIIASKSFSLSIVHCEPSIFARLDSDRIQQVLSNLIGNALKFAPHGSSIELSVHRFGEEVLVSVKDNGPGISDEKKAKVFERFSQLESNDRRGLGLGLFISKWIVEAHGGQISVESAPGAGTTFSFTLPAA
ncbi:MAG: sensor histidine kinase [Bdellovibrionota bacterium]